MSREKIGGIAQCSVCDTIGSTAYFATVYTKTHILTVLNVRYGNSTIAFDLSLMAAAVLGAQHALCVTSF